MAWGRKQRNRGDDNGGETEPGRQQRWQGGSGEGANAVAIRAATSETASG